MSKQDDALQDIVGQYSASGRKVDMLSTGITELDTILGGGIDCMGAMYSMWGEAGCGKSTIALQIAKEFLKAGKRVLLCDVEHAFNVLQERSFGLTQYLDTNQFIVADCDMSADIEQLVYKVATAKIDLFICDSLSQMIPTVNKEVTVMDLTPGRHARHAKQIMTVAKSEFHKSNTASIWVFHAAANIITGYGTGPATKQGGGFAEFHIPDVRMKLTPGMRVKEGDIAIGCVCKIECEKNKYAAPNQKIEKKLIYGKGIDARFDLIDYALSEGIITQRGGSYTYPWGEKVRGIKSVYNMSDGVFNRLQSIIHDGVDPGYSADYSSVMGTDSQDDDSAVSGSDEKDVHSTESGSSDDIFED